MHVDTVTIEVTRKCNMSCDHCLRGGAQNKDISDNHIKSLFQQVSSIGSLNITGGEPSMVPHKIQAIVKYAQEYNVEIDRFYMVTNGKHITKDFMLAVIELYCYCTDKEECHLHMSTDVYHEDDLNSGLLNALSFFDVRGEILTSAILNEGNGEDFGNDRFVTFEPFEHVDTHYNEISGGMIYLNALGNIVPSCDLSYESQDNPYLNLGNVNEISLFEACTKWNDFLEESDLEHMGQLEEYEYNQFIKKSA